jgi:hypothetical protein
MRLRVVQVLELLKVRPKLVYLLRRRQSWDLVQVLASAGL